MENRIDDYSLDAQRAFNTAVNILAVEYLIKTDNKPEYSRQVEQLSLLDHHALESMFLDLSLNMHTRNLGEMITQGDYAYQTEVLLQKLRGDTPDDNDH